MKLFKCLFHDCSVFVEKMSLWLVAMGVAEERSPGRETDYAGRLSELMHLTSL